MTTLSSGAATAMIAFALSRDLTTAEIEKATGISCHQVMKPDRRPPEDFMPKLWVLLGNRFPNEPIVLNMARATPYSFFGGLADGVKFADDLRSAIGLFVRNSSVIADQLELFFREESSEARLTSRHPLDILDNGRSAEIGAALAAKLFTEFLGVTDCIKGAVFRHEPNCDIKHYIDYFGGPVEFCSDETGIILNPDKLDTKIKYANLELFRYIETHLAITKSQIVIDKTPQELKLLQQAAVDNVRLGSFSTASVAAAANMSLRSAQRLTAAHGTTIQALIENVCEVKAKELLDDERIDINTIATSLGYTDERAFRRAFQRWTGQSPSHYRNKNQY